MKNHKPHPLPEIFYAHGNKFQVQLRGEKCYSIRSVDEHVYQYRVMERIVKTGPIGLVETLRDNQKFERFCSMEVCEKHFYAHERGEVELMLPIDNPVNTGK